MTLNGVMAVILRYFSEFEYLPGVLRKSSRIAVSHADEFLYCQRYCTVLETWMQIEFCTCKTV